MKPFVLTLRAIGTVLAMRLYVPAVTMAGVVFAVIIVGAVWLATLSDWWWLLFIPITILFCVTAAIATVVFMLIRFVRPDQTKAQKQAVNQFVDKAQGVTEIIGTPKFIILFRVIRSLARPSKNSYLSNLVSNRELASDFRDLQRMFTP